MAITNEVGTPQQRAIAPASVQQLERSIVVPAFDEEQRLPRSMAALAAHLDPATTEVIVVDDGSTDHTAAVADELLAEWPHGRRMSLDRNHGKGRAVRTGVLASTARHVAFVDADSATDSGCLHDLFAALETADVAIGSRALADSVVERYHSDRAVMGWAFNRLVRSATGVPWRDTQCGFKAFRTPVAKILFALGTVDGFAFDVELLDLAHRLRLRTVEVPVRWQHVEGSKVRHLRDSATMTYDVVRASRSEHRRPIECLHLGVSSCSDATEALGALPDDAVISWDRGTIEIVVPPGEASAGPGSARARAIEQLTARGIDVEPVVRSGTEVIERCRWGELSVGAGWVPSPDVDDLRHRTPADVCSDAAATLARRGLAVVGRRPAALSLLSHVAPTSRVGRIDDSTQLAIEGFPRSGTTFVATALRHATRNGLALVRHVHQPAQVRRSVERGVPTLLLVRRPLDAATSQLCADLHARPQQVLADYITYHEQLLPFVDDVEITDFDQAVADLAPVFGRLRDRFALDIPEFEHSERTVDRLFAAIDEEHMSRRPRDMERDVPRPSAVRAQSTERCRAQLEHPALSGLIDEAVHVHELFVTAAAAR